MIHRFGNIHGNVVKGTRNLCLLIFALVLVACGENARLPVSAGTGPDPQLPQPRKTLIPTVHVAEAVGWPDGAAPVAAEGMAVNLFADDLLHPRWLHVLPNGDVLVAESNAPAKSGGTRGIKGWIMGLMKKKAGAGAPSADRITLLRDTDGDGRADFRSLLLVNLRSPFGMALVGEHLYVANTDALVRYPYREGDTRIESAPELVVSLPAEPFNHHWTKNVIASPDGNRLFVTVGSNSNVAENGMEAEKDRAAILEVDPLARTYRVFAAGLRNPNGLAWEPTTGAFWTVVNERDELGSDLVPDYLTSVRDGGFYGWPYSYFGQHVDERVKPARPDLVAQALMPDYALGPHTASLGLAHSAGTSLPERFADGMFIGQHGSWNRRPRSGYKVIFIPFSDGRPDGDPVDVLTDFLNEEQERVYGRPVGVVLDQSGALLVADDAGNVIWRVSASPVTGS
jgi:glucose/arabinose dehydrogenase